MRVIGFDGIARSIPRYHDGALGAGGALTAAKLLRDAGLDPKMEGMQVTVDGMPASSDTPVGPESTVALQPRAKNG